MLCPTSPRKNLPSGPSLLPERCRYNSHGVFEGPTLVSVSARTSAEKKNKKSKRSPKDGIGRHECFSKQKAPGLLKGATPPCMLRSVCYNDKTRKKKNQGDTDQVFGVHLVNGKNTKDRGAIGRGERGKAKKNPPKGRTLKGSKRLKRAKRRSVTERDNSSFNSEREKTDAGIPSPFILAVCHIGGIGGQESETLMASLALARHCQLATSASRQPKEAREERKNR